MGSLQRSSYSFRRQGSSGKVWDRLPEREMNKVGHGQCVNAANDFEINQHNRFSHEIDDDRLSSSPVSATNAAGTKVNSGGIKGQRCSLGAIFGRCAGSPAT
ncbi:OLC1v1009453C1 [Oldenlandia corymbosa var. corymbosa]|uniref:OLC1v1009453C1 n=1 Tax=Oldenlandia corymbosa var. corymbosa TaxID=529605 RepID=A0AAV1DRX1_OLDCO|nr:OLC1v1009453C1 [Oldenlandia corymbosa var. corymbosa]